MIEVTSLTKNYGSFLAVDDLSFTVHPGEVMGLVGPNGAGKTTFMDVLCGKTKPDTGNAFLRETDLTKLDEKEIVDLGVGRKFQTPTVFGSLTLFENLLLALKTDRGIFRSLFGKLQKPELEKIHSVATTVGLHEQLHSSAGSLSHGQKQWLEIGMLLVMDPELLLIDEPAAGMSDEETAKTGWLLMELAKTRSVIVIEHDMEFVRQLQSQVTVLCEGKVLTQGPLEKVQNDPIVIEQYLGRAREKRKGDAHA